MGGIRTQLHIRHNLNYNCFAFNELLFLLRDNKSYKMNKLQLLFFIMVFKFNTNLLPVMVCYKPFNIMLYPILLSLMVIIFTPTTSLVSGLLSVIVCYKSFNITFYSKLLSLMINISSLTLSLVSGLFSS